MKTNKLTLAALAGLALTAGSANAVLTSQYGILDLAANGGINPNTNAAWAAGDEYRLAFHTAGGLTASDPDITVHNTAVTAAAHLNTALLGSSWTAMVSTSAVNVKDNTGTADFTGGAGIGGAGVPVYAMDGMTSIARNNNDIWNSWSNPFDGDAVVRLASGSTNQNSAGDDVVASQNVHYSPFLDQHGLGDTATVHGPDTWTGTNPGGSTHPSQYVGALTNTQTGNTNANNTGRVWQRGNTANTQERRMYAISEVLTVVPEPSTTALLGLGGLALIFRRRK